MLLRTCEEDQSGIKRDVECVLLGRNFLAIVKEFDCRSHKVANRSGLASGGARQLPEVNAWTRSVGLAEVTDESSTDR